MEEQEEDRLDRGEQQTVALEVEEGAKVVVAPVVAAAQA